MYKHKRCCEGRRAFAGNRKKERYAARRSDKAQLQCVHCMLLPPWLQAIPIWFYHINVQCSEVGRRGGSHEDPIYAGAISLRC